MKAQPLQFTARPPGPLLQSRDLVFFFSGVALGALSSYFWSIPLQPPAPALNVHIPREETLEDRKLVQRVRSKFGRQVRHPKSIYVEAHDGVVTLSGPILKDEVENLISTVEKVAGVTRVIQNLSIHETPGKVPGLQGAGSGLT